MQYLGIILLGFSVYVIIGNWVFLYKSSKTKRYHSPVPLVGPVAFVFGVFLIGYSGLWWIGFIVDYGTIIAFISLPVLFNEYFKTSKYNLVKQFNAMNSGSKYELLLFKKDIFVVRLYLERDKCIRHSKPLPTRMSFEGIWSNKHGVLGFSGYDSLREFELKETTNGYVVVEKNYPETRFPPYDKLDGLIFEVCDNGN